MFSPDRAGFFPALWVQLIQGLAPVDRETWSKLETREEKLKWIYGNRFIMERLELLRSLRQEKDLAGSRGKREAGNQAWMAGDTATALVNYSRAVVLAPDGTEDLGMAYANRAACLQKLGGYEFAIRDIKIALDNKYPQSSRFKLEERRAQCLVALKRYKEGKAALEAAVSLVKVANLEKQKLAKFMRDVDETLKKIDSELNKSKDVEIVANVTKSSEEKVKDKITQVASPSPVYPAATEAVTIKYQKGRGRFAVATKDIPVGTTILVEKPVTWALHPDRFGTHCQECLAQVKSVIPCRTCCGVSFCSLECRDIALNSYHSYECGLLEILVASGLNIYPYLVIRLLGKFGLETVWGYREELKHDETGGSETARPTRYESEDFMNAYNLVSHENTQDQEEQILRCFVAVFLLKLLQFNNFFGTATPEEKFSTLSDKEVYIGNILLHFINTIPQNVHDIALLETQDTRKWINSNKIKSLGAGVYLTAALYNHSCDPSFMRCNFGRGMVSVANRNILAGEEISECYGQMYYTKSSQQRKQELKGHYKFDCRCLACTENWPTIKDMTYAQQGGATKLDHIMRIKCQTCGQVLDRIKGVKVNSTLTCLVCGKESKVEDVPLDSIRTSSCRAEQLLSSSCSSSKTSNWEEGIQAVSDCQAEFGRYLVAPSLELYTTQISIWRALWILVGNKKLVKPF